jgi:ABC-type sugar transport system ATPase subunit
MSATEPLLVASGLSKRYAAVQALRDADLDIVAGEVHALVGVNGAGKSTLVKILTGAVSPDTGSVAVEGQPIDLSDPRASLDAGIACIYQESNLVPALSVMDNVLLGRQPARMGVVDSRALRRSVRELLDRYNLRLDPDAPVGSLSTVQQKQVEIAKALSLGAKVLLMDEPTAWLSQVEVEHLFDAVRRLTAAGAGILYISHVLDEIFAIANRVTVMRDGTVLSTSSTSDITKAALVQAMLGRELAAEIEHEEHARPELGEPILRCEGLTRAGAFEDVSLEVREREIVCITGLIGAGRSEVLRTIFGADARDGGTVVLHGREVRARRPRQAIRAGIGLIPEDRRRDGLLMSLSMRTNLVAAHLGLVSRRGIVSSRLGARLSAGLVEKLGIVPARIGLVVRKLSGGNQQKVLIGRWLARTPKLLMLDEPTVGVDVGAKADIYRLLRELADDGTAVLIVSSDMEEVLTVPDKVVVMASGRVTATLPRAEVTQDRVLAAASGEAVTVA